MTQPSAPYESPAITELGSVHELTLTKHCWKVTKKGFVHDLHHGTGLRKKFTYNCSIQPH